MERKESTPMREIRRKYEDIHKEERKARCKVWGTSIERSFADEMDEFLTKYNITKVAVIVAGYEALKKQYESLNK